MKNYNDEYHYYEDEDEARLDKPTLSLTLDALKAGEHGKAASTIFYGLSDLRPEEIPAVEAVWVGLTTPYRRKVARRMSETSETNFDLDYSVIGRILLDDQDDEVRQFAIDILVEDRGLDLMQRYIDLARGDEARDLRAAAASGLGAFILAGELGELPEHETAKAQRAMFDLLNDQDEPVEVRRRALEAVSNCGSSAVPPAIQAAYQSSERRMRVSAVYAMGRTCDPEWREIVLHELTSEDPEMRFEAARAAGELELRAAVTSLTPLTRDPDREIREMAIWALGEVGGEDAMKVLRKLLRDAERARDDDLIEVIEDAMGSASLGSDDITLS